MSTITVRYSSELELQVQDSKFVNRLISETASLLGKQPEEIIVDFVPWENPTNAPDVLIRAETSSKRRHLLDAWADVLLGILNEASITGRVAVKTYVIDSVWKESSR
jgi:hypothetical protein